MCPIWDNGPGAPPWPPGEYLKVAGGFATWAEALDAMNAPR